MDNNLIEALNNEENESILNLNSERNLKINLEILNSLNLDENIILDFYNKLKNYRYIDELDQLKIGSFIRNISLKELNENNINLYSGSFISEIKITEKGVILTCRNFRNKFISLKFEEHIIFQKFNNQELAIIKILDKLDKLETIY